MVLLVGKEQAGHRRDVADVVVLVKGGFARTAERHDKRDKSHGQDGNDDDSVDDNMRDLLMVRYIMASKKFFIKKIPCRTSMLSGKEYILKVLIENPSRCYEGFRMKSYVFKNLRDELKMMNLLCDANNVSVEEGVAMSLAILCHGTR